MYNIRKTNTIPTLAKRCCICGRFLFKRNLGKKEKFHKVNQFQYMCHSCLTVLSKEEIKNGEEVKQSE